MLKIKLLDPAAKVPTRAFLTDAGLDLYVLLDRVHVLAPKDFATFRTGVSMAIPDGFVGNIRPRSGLAAKMGIDVLAGTVDAAYRDEVRVVLINLGKTPYSINPGERIAQLVINRIELWTPEVVEELDGTDRGNNGFGSSGR